MYLPHAAKKNQCSIWHLCFMSLLVSSLWISVFCRTFQKSFMSLPLEGCRSRIVWRLAASCSNTAAAKVQAGWGWWPQSWHAMAMFFFVCWCALVAGFSQQGGRGEPDVGGKTLHCWNMKGFTKSIEVRMFDVKNQFNLLWVLQLQHLYHPKMCFIQHFLVKFLRSFMMFGTGSPSTILKDFGLMKCQTISPRTCGEGVRVLLSNLIWNVRLMSSYFNDFLGSHPCPVVLVSDDSCVDQCVQPLRGFWTCIHKSGGTLGGLWKCPCDYIYIYICIELRWIIYPATVAKEGL